MIVLFPKKDLSSVEENFTFDMYISILSNLEKQNITIYLPKFTFNTNNILNDYLSMLGMSDAFSTDADFSGISTVNNLFINLIIHQATIEINEQGTETTAVTAVMLTENGHSYQKVFCQSPLYFSD